MANAKDFLIALDDGHGMETSGKRSPYVPELMREIKENEFNKEITNYLNQELLRCGFRTLLLAPTDFDTPLSVRCSLANRNRANLVVSNHANAFDGSFDGADPKGVEIHVYTNPCGSEDVAKCVLDYIKLETDQEIRGIKYSDFQILRDTNMLAILVENLFMDNREEVNLMLDVEYQINRAKQQARGICKYFNVPYVEEKVVEDIQSEETVFALVVAYPKTLEEAERLQQNISDMYYRMSKVGNSIEFDKGFKTIIKEIPKKYF